MLEAIAIGVDHIVCCATQSVIRHSGVIVRVARRTPVLGLVKLHFLRTVANGVALDACQQERAQHAIEFTRKKNVGHQTMVVHGVELIAS